MKINRTKFFKNIRSSPFPGKLKQTQVNGLNTILDAWESTKQIDLRWLAYILGTTAIETGMRYEPLKELGGNAYLRNNYDITGKNPTRAKSMGNAKAGDGILYCGRGFVQLTWKKNYIKYKDIILKKFGVDIVANPDEAMQPDIAAYIIVDGMINGVFTGKKLSEYFNSTKTDWVNARRIVNGTDKASQIAAVSKEFYADLNVAV